MTNKTLRIREREGWITKPIAALPSNSLTPEEVDDNFIALDERISQLELSGAIGSTPPRTISTSAPTGIPQDGEEWIVV